MLPVLGPVPAEYLFLENARSVLLHPGDLVSIEKAQKNAGMARQIAESRALDKDLDEVFYALEFRRAEKLTKKKSWKSALASFHRGLNGMHSYKWVYYWNEESSNALLSICNRSKKLKDEECLSLAKRVVDAFPKTALETAAMRDLEFESSGNSEVGGDRLSQSYSEKIEKDEKAFEEVLAAYLEGDESKLSKVAKEFVGEYPKSILRFRTSFLLAEMANRRKDSKASAPLYQVILEQIPLSYYAVVAAERLGLTPKDRIKKEPLLVDRENFNASPYEKQTLERIQVLIAKKLWDEAGLELETLNRVRVYADDFLVYLMGLATQANQNLLAFRITNELIQRRYEGVLQSEFLDMVFPDRFQKEFEDQAREDAVDPILLKSLTKQESGFSPSIISSSGAVGLMQLMPFTAVEVNEEVHLAQLRFPLPNIEVGTRYLASLLEKQSGNVAYSLAAYNAGPHRLAKWKNEAKPEWGMVEFIESIPYKETRDYVMSILRNRYWYQARRGMPNHSVFDGWVVSPPSAKSP